MKKISLIVNICLPVAVIILVSGCSKQADEAPPQVVVVSSANPADIIAFSINGQDAQVSISQSAHTVWVQLPDTVNSGANLVASFTLSPGCTATVNNQAQVSGVSANDFSDDVFYNITAPGQAPQGWTVTATNNSYTYSWGMGHFLQSSMNNNRGYNWYIDQGTTGIFAPVNCGPSSVTMAVKWADSTYANNAEYARSKYEPQGGWWYSTDIIGFLNDNGIPHAIVALADTQDSTEHIIEGILNKGEILIFNPDMNVIPSAYALAYHVDKFYATTPGWGHYAIIKGYKRIDGKTFFETYDPFTFGELNVDDNMPKGENHYYRAADVFTAAYGWWNYVFVIARKGDPVQRSTELPLKGLDVKRIPLSFGM